MFMDAWHKLCSIWRQKKPKSLIQANEKENAEKMATEENEQLVIHEKLTQQDIANRVGASREMVAKIMKDLTTGGYIEAEDRKIIIRKRLPSRY